MYLWRIALRNLSRRRRRTLLTAGVLATAVVVYLLCDAFLAGMEEMSYTNIINLQSGHLEVGRTSFFANGEEPSLENLFRPAGESRERLVALEGFEGMTPVLDFAATINNGRDEYPVMVRAIEPQSYSRVFTTAAYLTGGRFIRAGDSGLVIGSRLAELLELKVGDFYILLFRAGDGSFNTIEGEISGIIHTPHPDMNLGCVFLSLDYARAPLGVEETEINRLLLRFNDRKFAVPAAVALQAVLESDLTVRTWEDAAELIITMRAIGQLENLTILGVILVIGAVGIINIIILSALERVEEIGVMKATGFEEGDIVKIFVLEAGGIGLLGSFAGCTLGGVIVALFNRFGISLAVFGMAETTYGLPVIDRLYGGWSPGAFLLVFVFGVAVALLAGIPPARWAARKDPVRAIYRR